MALLSEKSRSKIAIILFSLAAASSTTTTQAQCSTAGPNNPSAAASVSFAGSNFSFSNPNYCFLSDNNRATASALLSLVSGTTDYLQATGFGFSIPAGATICGIQVDVQRSASGLILTAAVSDHAVSIIKGGALAGTPKAGGNWPSSDATATYGSNSDKWGTTWLVSDVNASNFGVAVSADITGLIGVAPSAQINQIQMTVYYQPPAVLPLQLTNFNVTGTAAHTAMLSWQTPGANEPAGFTVERSANGANWEALPGSPVKDILTFAYSYIDANPLPQQSYYRLKCTTASGTVTYSESRLFTSAQNNVIKCYPNPAVSRVYLAGIQAGSHIGVTNMYGQAVPAFITITGNNQAQIDVTALQPGVYLIHVDNVKMKIQKK